MELNESSNKLLHRINPARHLHECPICGRPYACERNDCDFVEPEPCPTCERRQA